MNAEQREVARRRAEYKPIGGEIGAAIAEAFADPDFEVAALLPCIDCDRPVEVTRFVADMAKGFNRIARRRGFETLKGVELALCPACWDLRREQQRLDAERLCDRDFELWSGFRERYQSASADERRGIEREFFKSVDDRPLYSDLAKRWIEKLTAREARRGHSAAKRKASLAYDEG